MQGMCDLVAPILVTFDDEALTYACFSKLMQRMIWKVHTTFSPFQHCHCKREGLYCASNHHGTILCSFSNFPTGTQMDENFASMRSLIQVFDQTLYNAIQQSGDFSHFYFCYRYAIWWYNLCVIICIGWRFHFRASPPGHYVFVHAFRSCNSSQRIRCTAFYQNLAICC